MHFIYNPFSPSSYKLQVSDGSWQWLLEGLLASSLAAIFLQVTVSDHKMVSSQSALKNVCVRGRIMVMEWERQKEPLHMEPHTKPAIHAISSCHPTISPFSL